MRKDLEEINSWKIKFKEFTSDASINLTLYNLNFPYLEEPEDIETFFSALESLGYNASCKKLELIIRENRVRTKLILSTLRNVIDAEAWSRIKEYGNRRQPGDDFLER